MNSSGPPVLRIDLDLPVPAYRQIVDAVRALIVEGGLAPGDRLPGVRDLAADLGVHHNTVAEAYRLLAAEGWLDLGRRRGATVLRRGKPRSTAAAREQFARSLRELVARAQSDGLTRREINSTLRTHLPEESEPQS